MQRRLFFFIFFFLNSINVICSYRFLPKIIKKDVLKKDIKRLYSKKTKPLYRYFPSLQGIRGWLKAFLTTFQYKKFRQKNSMQPITIEKPYIEYLHLTVDLLHSREFIIQQFDNYAKNYEDYNWDKVEVTFLFKDATITLEVKNTARSRMLGESFVLLRSFIFRYRSELQLLMTQKNESIKTTLLAVLLNEKFWYCFNKQDQF